MVFHICESIYIACNFLLHISRHVKFSFSFVVVFFLSHDL